MITVWMVDFEVQELAPLKEKLVSAFPDTDWFLDESYDLPTAGPETVAHVAHRGSFTGELADLRPPIVWVEELTDESFAAFKRLWEKSGDTPGIIDTLGILPAKNYAMSTVFLYDLTRDERLAVTELASGLDALSGMAVECPAFISTSCIPSLRSWYDNANDVEHSCFLPWVVDDLCEIETPVVFDLVENPTRPYQRKGALTDVVVYPTTSPLMCSEFPTAQLPLLASLLPRHGMRDYAGFFDSSEVAEWFYFADLASAQDCAELKDLNNFFDVPNRGEWITPFDVDQHLPVWVAAETPTALLQAQFRANSKYFPAQRSGVATTQGTLSEFCGQHPSLDLTAFWEVAGDELVPARMDTPGEWFVTRVHDKTEAVEMVKNWHRMRPG